MYSVLRHQRFQKTLHPLLLLLLLLLTPPLCPPAPGPSACRKPVVATDDEDAREGVRQKGDRQYSNNLPPVSIEPVVIFGGPVRALISFICHGPCICRRWHPRFFETLPRTWGHNRPLWAPGVSPGLHRRRGRRGEVESKIEIHARLAVAWSRHGSPVPAPHPCALDSLPPGGWAERDQRARAWSSARSSWGGGTLSTLRD